jgi:hypothetical protein
MARAPSCGAGFAADDVAISEVAFERDHERGRVIGTAVANSEDDGVVVTSSLRATDGLSDPDCGGAAIGCPWLRANKAVLSIGLAVCGGAGNGDELLRRSGVAWVPKKLADDRP